MLKVMLLVMLILLPNHGNADKLGNKDAREYITNDKFVTIIGTIEMPEANSEQLGSSASFKYPEGFNGSNCVIISLMSHNSIHPDWWNTRTSADGVGYAAGSQDLRAALKPNEFTVWSTKASTAQSRNDVTFKITLMKLPELLEGTDYKLGDVNGDGKITQEDADLVNKFYVGTIALTDRQVKAADVNKDGKVTPADATKIQQYISGTIKNL